MQLDGFCVKSFVSTITKWLAGKTLSQSDLLCGKVTYCVSSGTLNSIHSVNVKKMRKPVTEIAGRPLTFAAIPNFFDQNLGKRVHFEGSRAYFTTSGYFYHWSEYFTVILAVKYNFQVQGVQCCGTGNPFAGYEGI